MTSDEIKKTMKKISPFLWEIPKDAFSDMRVPAFVFLTEGMLNEVVEDKSLAQLVNIATLPGIVERVAAMPDIHEGYGFPIGGIAATEYPQGIISPGGVGYDINCGVRLLLSDKTFSEIDSIIGEIAAQFMRAVPSGTGRGGRIKLTIEELDDVLRDGARWCVQNGYADLDDPNHLEENGRMDGADPSLVSETAKRRGRDQLGTLGSGNHFLEIERVDEIFDTTTAEKWRIKKDQVVVSIHCGSRGLGHQICSDYVRLMRPKLFEYGIELPDPELACAPADSEEGKKYLSAMACAANFAWANRQIITHHLRGEWTRIFGNDSKLKILYDVCHNIAKIETHTIRNEEKKLIVHRKGATRAFPDQPVLIPGTMGTSSYVLVGTEEAMKQTFGTVCHGAGRRMSRHEAKRTVSGKELRERLEEKGIAVRCFSTSGLAEEAPEAYKDVDEVVNVVVSAGLSQKVARLRPIAVIKGD